MSIFQIVITVLAIIAVSFIMVTVVCCIEMAHRADQAPTEFKERNTHHNDVVDSMTYGEKLMNNKENKESGKNNTRNVLHPIVSNLERNETKMPKS